jgi:hypothetical protein
LDPLPELIGLFPKEDFIKIMMNRFDELAHIPPKSYDKVKELVQKADNSNQKLAERLSHSIVTKLKNDESRSVMHEGFDPIVAVEDVVTKHAAKAIDTLMSGQREQPFQQFQGKFKALFVQGVGEVFEEL